MNENNSDASFPIVAIGASAGGLHPLQCFIAALPKNFGFSIVFMQHLSTKHKSLLAGLLNKSRPDLDIKEVSEGLELLPSKVYICPPGVDVTLRLGTFHVEPQPETKVHLPINDFFSAVAQEAGERVISVIFSGAGTDGAIGVREIRTMGGTVFVQDPLTAEFPSMPLAAIATGRVDGVLAPENIALEILKMHDAGTVAAGADDLITPAQFAAFYKLLRDKAGYDLSLYKKNVVSRRISRRMYLRGTPTITDYLKFLAENVTEITSMVSDLMIGVTSFFRDPLAWKALKTGVIRKLAAAGDESPIRVWTPASATGEEAYSIAMMLHHELELAGRRREIQVFATDVNERALEKAREGRYPSGISSEIPPAFMKKYFTYTEDGLFAVISKEIRGLVVFARHDLLVDPPFSRLDLVICRNLMIYLEPEAQEKCLVLFHYGLKPGGFLFLGNAESPGRNIALFKSLAHKKCRIYEKVETKPSTRMPVPLASERPVQPISPQKAEECRQSVTGIIQEALLEEYAPAAVAFDQNYDILYHNGPTNRYLCQPRGAPTRNLLELLPANLRSRVRGALYKASRDGKHVSIRTKVQCDDGQKREVTLSISQIRQDLFLFVFREKLATSVYPEETCLEASAVEETAVRQIENELAATRQDLQSNIEQLKGLNEEMQSANEELQAANEELETSREELQSLNEEMITVNAQLQSKIEEQEMTNNNLNNFLSSTNIPTLFLDQQFRVRLFTPAMSRLIKLIPADIGRPIMDMSQDNLGPELISDAEAVLEQLVPMKREILMNDAWYVRAVLPYRTADNRIEGVVITYNDITEIKAAEERTRHLATFPQLNPSPVIEVDSSGKVSYFNQAAQKVLKDLGMDKENISAFLPQDLNIILEDLKATKDASFYREVMIRGKVFGATVQLVPNFDVVRIYAFDITNRKLAEGVIRARLQMLMAANTRAMSVDETLQLALDEIEARTSSTIGFYHFLEEDQETLSLQNWSTNTLRNMCSAEGKGSHYPVSQAGVWVECVVKRQPVIHNDYASLPHRKGMPQGHATVVREMIIPVMRGDRIVAVIGVGNKPTDYTETDVEIALSLGDLSWEIVERKRTEEALRGSEKQYRELFENMTEGFAYCKMVFEDGKPQDFIYLSVNRAFEVLTGLKNVVGKRVTEVIPGIREADSELLEIYGRVSLTGKPERFEMFVEALKMWFSISVYSPEKEFFVAVFDVITERKKAEEAQGRLAAIVESAEDAIIGKDLDGIIQTWNVGAEHIFGYKAEEVIGKPISLLIPPGYADEVPEILAKIKRGEHIENFEALRMRKDGTIIPVSLKFSAIKDANGRVIGASKIAHDITERKRAEELLRKSEEQFRTLADSIPNLAWWADADGYITWYNTRWYDYTGTTPKEMEGWGWQIVHDPLVLPEVLERWKASISTGEPFDMEFPLRGADGIFRPFLTRVMPMKDSAGKIIRWFGTNTDVTDRKLAETALQQSLSRFGLLTVTAGELLQSTEPQRVVESVCNKVMQYLDCHAFFNFLVDEQAGRLHLNAYEGIPEEEAKKIEWLDFGVAVCGCAARDGQRIVAENIPTTQDERTVLVKSYGIRAYCCHPLLGPGGQVIGTLSFGTCGRDTFSDEDLSLMKAVADQVAVAMTRIRAKEELERLVVERTRFYSVLARTNEAIVRAQDRQSLFDEVCRIIVENGQFKLAWVGLLDPESRAVMPAASFGERAYLEGIRIIADDVPEGKGPTGRAVYEDHNVINTDFEEDPLVHPWREKARAHGLRSSSAFPLHTGGKVVGALTIYSEKPDFFNDEEISLLVALAGNVSFALDSIETETKRSAAEDRLRLLNEELETRVKTRTSELEDANGELESFVYSVSHDLRAPLRSMSSFAKFLMEDYTAVLDDQGKDYLSRINRGATKMSALINDLLELSKLSRQELSRREVNISVLAASIVSGLREADPGRVVGVSIENGLIAEADPSLLEIVLSNIIGNAWKFTSKTAKARIEFGALENPSPIVYYVRDNGAGFDPEYAAKMFLPFHRLHSGEEFEGTGIGLAIVERIIRKHNGNVWSEGEIGKGATVYFTLG